MARDGDNDCAVTFCFSKVGARHASKLFTIRGELKGLALNVEKRLKDLFINWQKSVIRLTTNILLTKELSDPYHM